MILASLNMEADMSYSLHIHGGSISGHIGEHYR